MGKFLSGCLIAVAVVVVGGGAAGYYFFIKPAGEFVGDMARFAQEFEELNERVERRTDFTPPADGNINEQQFQRYLAAQRDMRGRLETRLETLDEKYTELKAQMERDDREINFREMAGAYRDMGDLILEGKRAQVEALNRHDFSLEEYIWVRNQAYRAIGESVAVASIGDQQAQERGYRRVPEETVQMVEPHREELMETHVLAWFGL